MAYVVRLQLLMERKELWHLGLKSIQTLEVQRGILASGREEAYGCVFGRDSLITALELLRTHRYRPTPGLLPLVRKILRSLADLQGTEHMIESGEEPGKIIHEFRTEGHEHLTRRDNADLPAYERAWYIYPDGAMRNYDSVDATPLFLMALHRYAEVSGDDAFLEELETHARNALGWVLRQNDLIVYAFPPDRRHGGLRTQSWMDSGESLFYEHGNTTPPYPIAPLEVQAYAWAALSMWSMHFAGVDTLLSAQLHQKACALKATFNNRFVIKHGQSISLAFALDGNGKQLTSPRSSMGHVLWAAYNGACILQLEYVPLIVKRLMMRDLFVPGAGIRTLSSRSSRFDPHSYHNGSIWPHDTALIAEGFENFGFSDDAHRVRDGLLRSYEYFQTPIELFAYKYKLREYAPASGHRACRTQAWSAAGLLLSIAADEA